MPSTCLPNLRICLLILESITSFLSKGMCSKMFKIRNTNGLVGEGLVVVVLAGSLALLLLLLPGGGVGVGTVIGMDASINQRFRILSPPAPKKLSRRPCSSSDSESSLGFVFFVCTLQSPVVVEDAFLFLEEEPGR